MKEKNTLKNYLLNVRDYISNIPKGVKTAIVAGALFGMISTAALPVLYGEQKKNIYDIGATGFRSFPQTSLSLKLDREELEIPEQIPKEIYNKWGLSDRLSFGAELNQTLFGTFGLDIGGVFEPLSAYMGPKNFLSLDINTHRVYANARLQAKLENVTPFISGGLNYSFWNTNINIDENLFQLIEDIGLIPPEDIPDSVNAYLFTKPGLGWQAFIGARAKINKSKNLDINLMARIGYISMNSGPIEKAVLEVDGEKEELNLREFGDFRLNRRGPIAEIGVSFEY